MILVFLIEKASHLPTIFNTFNEAAFDFETESGYKFKLLLNNETTIGKIKANIEKIIKIPSIKLQLFLGNNKIEEDNKTLIDINQKYNNILTNYNTFIVKFQKDKDINLIIYDDNNIIEISINSMDNAQKLYNLVNYKIGKNINNHFFLEILLHIILGRKLYHIFGKN